MPKRTEVKTVSAVGSTASGRTSVGALVQAAMAAAIDACMKKGITDPDLQREAMLKAREKVKKDFAAAEAKAAKAAKRT